MREGKQIYLSVAFIFSTSPDKIVRSSEQAEFSNMYVFVESSFLTQLVREPTREGVLLDLLFVNRGGWVSTVTVRGHLGHSDHEIIEF